MKVKIYRGTKEIGGTCIELTAQNGKKLWIDIGLPLNKTNPNIDYARINKPDALLISHPHQDHYGLMDCIDKTVPIYIGQISLDLINAAKIFLERPSSSGNFKIINPWEWFTAVDTFKVKPYLVDHSSPEAFAFFIEADGKRIFYSGDFRATGRKNKLFENLIKNPPSNIDLLLLEGTMVERENKDYEKEEDIEHALIEIFKSQKNVSFVISSAQNIDRFVSVIRACMQTGKKVVVDIYNAWVLDMIKKKSPRLPAIEWDTIKVYNHPSQLEKIQKPEFENFKKRIEHESVGNVVFSNPSNYVYFLRCPSDKLIDALRKHGKINLIYSQWKGYLEDEHKTYFTEPINNLRNDKDIIFHDSIHTSGHATLKDLKNFARSLKPKKIVPIHTEKPERMKVEFENDGFKNVYLWDDNKEYEF